MSSAQRLPLLLSRQAPSIVQLFITGVGNEQNAQRENGKGA
jgi:hypothetical protein